MKYLILLFVLAGCTDASYDYLISSYNETFDVVCYSGGKAVYTAKTSGKVEDLAGGGWAFRTTEGVFVQTYADCFVSFKK